MTQVDGVSTGIPTTATPTITTTTTTQSSRGNKTPPSLQKAKSYDDWVKKLKVWKIVTCLPKCDQGGAILNSLEGAEGEAEDAILELTVEELTSENSVDLIVARLDKIFKKNETIEKFEIIDSFQTYSRPHHVSINDFIIEFDKRLTKTKKIGTVHSDDFLAYRLIKSAKMSEQEEKMVKATCELKYDCVKAKLKSIFGDAGSQVSQRLQPAIKTEDVFYETHGSTNSNRRGNNDFRGRGGNRGRGRDDVYYESHSNNNRRGNNDFRGRGGRGRGRNSNRGRGRGVRRNPLDKDGNVTTCLRCKCEYHYIDVCPYRNTQENPQRQTRFDENSALHLTDGEKEDQEESSLLTEEIIFLQSDYQVEVDEEDEEEDDAEENEVEKEVFIPSEDVDEEKEESGREEKKEEVDIAEEAIFAQSASEDEDKEGNEKENEKEESSNLSELLAETWNAALLDTGATKTCSGEEWVDNYVSSLPEEQQQLVKYDKSVTSYRFGDGKKVKAKKSVKLPAMIGGRSVWITSDIVKARIPLLLSRKSMKRGKMKLDLENDKAELFGAKVTLKTTKKGHYVLPLTGPLEFMHRFEKGNVQSFCMAVTKCDNDKDIALKLHKVFAHPSEKKLTDLVNGAGKKWSENENLKQEIKSVSENCETCEKFRRPSPRPSVGLSMATTFNECVAMDLKFYKGKILLHLIDHASRLSNGSRVSSKNPEVIVKSIFKNWIAIYGRPNKFLSDNGGEFMNHQFIDLREKMNISMKNTAGKSPWSNGLVERHNLVVAEMLDKVTEESKCDFDLALAWVLNAKNSLKNVNGFSPYQIAMGQNPKMPVAVDNELPANSLANTSDIVRENLNALHAARKAWVETEFSRKIKLALSKNIRSESTSRFYTGDRALYKRDNSTGWKGPGSVIGQDGSKIIIKHGPYTVSVHPCRVVLKNEGEKSDRGGENSDTIEKSNEDTGITPPGETRKEERDMCKSSNTKETQEDDESDNEGISTSTSTVRTVELNTPLRTTSPDEATTRAPDSAIVKPKKGQRIAVNVTGHPNEWSEVEISSRAGKATGKYKNYWNVK